MHFKLTTILFLCAAHSFSQAILETYFVPIQEDLVQIANAEFAQACGAGSQPGDAFRSVISIVANSDNTVIVYDHWEDGYETDPNNPTQTSTEIWGDNNPANGIPPGYATDIVNAGAIINLDNTISIANLGAIDYDARDKIGASAPLAVTRAGWHITPGPVLAGAIEVQNVEDLGNCYIAPFGEDTNIANGMFLHSYFFIQATENNTTVEVDANADGIAELTNTLQEGEVWLVNNLLEGATVNGDAPLSVSIISGDTACFESRWYRMTPKDQWVDNYCSPIGTTQADDPAILYIYNPGPGSIIVDVQTALGTTPITIAPNDTAVYQYPLGSGGSCLRSQGGEPYYAAVTVDDSLSHDWGMTLIPECNTSSQLLVGWGPGSGDLTVNGSPVWVTAQQATTIYIDYDGDPSTGLLTDPAGNQYDEVRNVAAFELIQVFDTSDNDQTGTRIYTLDSTLLSGAWGQDPANSDPGNPYLDMGTTVLPVPILGLIETFDFTGDTDGDGRFDPGETATVTLCVTNVGLSSLSAVDLNVFFDPNNLLYATNTTLLDGVPISDDTNGVTLFPLDEGQQLLGDLAPGEQFKVQYDLQVSPAFTNCDGQLDENFIYTSTANDTCAGARLITGLPQPADFDPGLDLFVVQPTNCNCAGESADVIITVSNSGTWLLDGIDIDAGVFGACEVVIPPLLGGESYTYTCQVSSASTVTDNITASILLCGTTNLSTNAIVTLDVDTTPPTFTPPGNTSISCDLPTDPGTTGSVSDLADNCDTNPVATFADTETPGLCPQEKTISRLWTVTDACGNAATYTQSIVIVDVIPPTFTAPTNVTIECTDATDPSNTGTVTNEADNCDTNPVVTFADTVVPGACPQESEILRVWTATDACGNASSATQTITVVDTTAPTFTVPADTTIECDASTNTANTGVVTAEADNCDPAPLVSFADTLVPGACPQEQDILRVWTVTDACGNATSATQTISVVDTTAPTFTLPVDLTIECDASTNIVNTGAASAQSDNCDTNPTTTFADTIVPGACPQENDILRAWTVTDACGNASTATQTITVVDTPPPTFSVPTNVTVECTDSIAPEDTGLVTNQADNCDTNPAVVFVDTAFPGACPQESTIFRVWTSTDDCGNETMATQIITVVDTVAPTFTVPTNVTVECDESTEVANTGDATAIADNCDLAPIVTFTDTPVAGACPQEGTILRVWLATDACGNASLATQTITIVDTTPPTFTLPADLTIECDASTNTVNTGVASAQADNCDLVPATSFVDTIVPGACPQENDILRAWTVTDACGNATTAPPPPRPSPWSTPHRRPSPCRLISPSNATPPPTPQTPGSPALKPTTATPIRRPRSSTRSSPAPARRRTTSCVPGPSPNVTPPPTPQTLGLSALKPTTATPTR